MEASPVDIRATDELLGGGHPGLGGALGAADAGELGRALGAAAGLDRAPVDRDRDALPAQPVGECDGQVGRNGRVLDLPPLQRPDRGLQLGLVARHARFDEIEEAEPVERQQLRAGQDLGDPRGLQ